LPPRGERRFCPYQRNQSAKSGPKSGPTKLEDGVIPPPTLTLDAPCELPTDLTTVINSQGPAGPVHEMSHFCTNDENGNSVDKKLSSDITKSPRLVENLIDSKDSIGNSRSPSYKSTEQ